LIPGGNDIDSRHWGEPLHAKAELIEEARHHQERAIYEAIPKDLPVLGICYGCQFINVMEGGSLIQHLPEVTGHDADQHGTVQTYAVTAGSLTATALGTSLASGQSWHHQALGNVPVSLKVVAQNPDGTIEAIESCARPWMIGVQWHPERTSEAQDSSSLFKAFIAAAAEYRGRRA
jgi:putative glutamine amidotransferase